ncbi:MAG: 2-phosphosulfolactate phosphatase [Gammaproteobacteria bacterium]
MKINVLQHIGDNSTSLEKVVVVIDQYRASSTIVTALANGVQKIIPCLSLEEALAKKALSEYKNFLVLGEQNARKSEKASLGNSPLPFTVKNHGIKEILMATTNGTKALKRAQHAQKIMLCSFLNLSAIAEKLIKCDSDFTILCSGSKGKFCLEDVICASLLIQRIQKKESCFFIDDFTRLVAALNEDQQSLLCESKSYKKLKSLGFNSDLDFCDQQDLYESVPVYLKTGFIKECKNDR